MSEFEDILNDYLEEGERIDAQPFPIIPKPTWLYDFTKDVLDYDLLEPQPHYELCNQLEDIVQDCQFRGLDRRAILIEMPRGNYKTTVAGEALPLGVLTKNPNARILITTHTQKMSSKRLGAIKTHIQSNEKFHDIYGNNWKPQFRNGQWSSTALTISKRTKVFREASIEVAAAGADATGSHFDLIICDDIVQRENVRQTEQRDKIYDYINTLWSLLDPGGVLIIMGTRWHPDDAYGRILEKERQRKEKGMSPLYRTHIRSCYDGPNGLLFPSQYGFEQLEDIRQRIGERNFAANYLNQPVAEADKAFKQEFLVEKEFTYYYTGKAGGIVNDGQSQYPVYVTMAWDTAGTRSSTKSDYHGLTVRGTDNLGRAWSLDAQQVKGTPSQVVSRVVSMLLLFKPERLLIEAVGSFEHWLALIERAMEQYGIRTTVVQVSHGGVPKEERIQMLEPLWCNRGIILKPDQRELKEQFDNFSMDNNLAHDDLIDSFQMHQGHTQPGAAEYRQKAEFDGRDARALDRMKRLERESPISNRFLLGRRKWR